MITRRRYGGDTVGTIGPSEPYQAPSQSRASTGDSYVNFLARVGITGGQPINQSGAGSYRFDPITRNRQQLEWMYRGSWLAGSVVDSFADDMTRQGISLTGDIDPKAAERFNEHWEAFRVWDGMNESLRWSRLYGGSMAVIMIDGQDPSTPLLIDRIGKGQFRGVLPLDRWMVQPSFSKNETIREYGPDIGMPMFYTVTANAQAMSGAKIHYSRVIRFDGVKLPWWQRVSENGWGMSVIERLLDRLVTFDSATLGAGQLTYKAHLRIVKMKNLRESIGLGKQFLQAVVQHVEMMRATQSNEGITLLDAEDTYEGHQISFSGLAEVLIHFGQQISGASGIPLVRLFGQSPAGLNSTGESDIRNYYDNVKQRQSSDLKRPITRLAYITAKSLDVDIPSGFGVAFNPLWQMSETEKATVGSTITATVTQAGTELGLPPELILRELKQFAQITGLWTNITSEMIREAESMPPEPDFQEEPIPVPDPTQPGETDPGTSGSNIRPLKANPL